MSLQQLINLSIESDNRKLGLSEQRIDQSIDEIRDKIAFFRQYPDLLIDFMLKDNNPNNFHFYFYQRIFLRIVMRHRYVYATFPRAYSKSFLSMMVLILRCILYPGSDLFVTTGGRLNFC